MTPADHDAILEIWLKLFFPPVDLREIQNVPFLEQQLTHRFRLLKILTPIEKTVFEKKAKGCSLTSSAQDLGKSPEETLDIEKRLLEKIRLTRERPHIHHGSLIRCFYCMDDLEEIRQVFVRQKTAVIPYDALLAAARCRNMEKRIPEIIQYLHRDFALLSPEGDLRLLPQSPVSRITRMDRAGNQKLRHDAAKWHLFLDEVIRWSKASPRNRYDALHQAIFQKYLSEKSFLKKLYILRQQNLDAFQMAEMLHLDPIDVYNGFTMVWDLYKATFPVSNEHTD